jgi:hypothetical protein
VEAAENRIVLQSDTPASAEADAVAECQFPAEAAARVDPDTEVSLSTFKDGFQVGDRVQDLFDMSPIADRVDL